MGRYLITELLVHGHQASALICVEPTPPLENVSSVHWADLNDVPALEKAVSECMPDACIHLAALSSVMEGKANPKPMFGVNVMGTLNLLEAFRKFCPKARLLIVSSAQVYGSRVRQDMVKESDAMDPVTAYGASKAAQDLMSLAFAREHGMNIVVVRPHNHIGPGQSTRFVVPSFARQIKEIANMTSRGPIQVGNLQSHRDFTDVRDVVRGYAVLLEKGKAGEAYNMASNRPIRISEIFTMLCEFACIKPEVKVDPGLYRPAEDSPSLDITKILRDADWRPRIPIKTTLRDIYESV